MRLLAPPPKSGHDPRTDGQPFVVATTTSRSTAFVARAWRTCSSFARIPEAQLYRLEQNYRSSAAILAGQRLIAHNSARLARA